MRLGSVKNFIRYLFMASWNHILTYLPSYTLRYYLLKYVFRAKLGKCNIHMGVKFFSPWKLTVGNGTNIQYGCFIDCRGTVVIGDNVDITLFVKILSQDHDINSPDYETRSRPVIIGSGSVIGSYALMLPGSAIGKHSVLAAGALLTKPFGDNLVIAGNPGAVIRTRPTANNYSCSYRRPFH